MGYLLAFTVVLGALLFIYSRLKPTNSRQPPGPWGLPVLGHMHLLGAKPGKTLLKWRKKYGPIVSVRIGKMPAVAISDVYLIQEAFGQRVFSGRPTYKIDEFGKKGIVRGDDIETTEQRKFFHSAFNSKESRDSAEGRIREEVDALIFMKNDKPRDDPQTLEFLQNLSRTIRVPNFIEVIAMFTNFVDFLVKNDRKKNIQDAMSIIKKKFKEHKLTWVPGQPRDLTDAFWDKQDSMAKESPKFRANAEEHFLGSIYDASIAGYDTTSITKEWIFVYLTKFPEVRRKFQEEIDAKVGLDRTPSLSDEPNMPYVQAVLNEVLRISSIGPLSVFHRAMEDVEFKGYFIPKDTIVIGNLYAANWDKDIWGDPHVFRPERFLDSQGNFVQRDELLAFSTGKRLCIGERLARNNMFLFSTIIFQEFNTEFAGTEPSFEGSFGLFSRPYSFSLKFIKRH
ncbi:unnamed protein product [Allacma fusca]|uniref:Cytochrome P450 n=1 Tax=Allacma fusca TaxID=39272 RepID=A0A8J2JJT1_9HEXA|nr:unnamed protein product [Allacma fusca]